MIPYEGENVDEDADFDNKPSIVFDVDNFEETSGDIGRFKTRAKVASFL